MAWRPKRSRIKAIEHEAWPKQAFRSATATNKRPKCRLFMDPEAGPPTASIRRAAAPYSISLIKNSRIFRQVSDNKMISMHPLAVLVGLFSAAAAIVSLKTGDHIVLLLAGAVFLCAFTTYRSRAISTFLQIFAAIFAAETVLFGTVFLAAQTGLGPSSLEEYELPESLPLTVAIFGILVHAISFIPVVRSMTRIADRYFDTSDETRARIWPFLAFSARERRVAIAMVVLLVVINQAQVGMNLRLSFFHPDLVNALPNKDEG